MRSNMKLNIRTNAKRKLLFTGVILVALLVSIFGVQIQDAPRQSPSNAIASVAGKVVTLGSVAYAAGDVDYTFDGTDDNVQFQAALDALPAGGGRLVVVSATTINFSATVSRAIDNVVISGTGQGSYFANDGITALFTAGGNNWQFENLRTDAGGITMGATTGWQWFSVNNGTNYYTLLNAEGTQIIGDAVAGASGTFSGLATAGGITYSDAAGVLNDDANLTFDGTSLQVSGENVVRTATYVVAASDAPAHVKAQADYVCDGTDDDVQIQAAIGTGDVDILLSKGTFYITTSIDVGFVNTKLRGSGIGLTTIKPSGDVKAISNTATALSGLIELSGFTIDGQNQTGSEEGVRLNRINCYVHDIKLYRTSGSGFYGDTAGIYSMDLNNIYLNACGTNGIDINNMGLVCIRSVNAVNMANASSGGMGVIRLAGTVNQWGMRGELLIDGVTVYNTSSTLKAILLQYPREAIVNISNVNIDTISSMAVQVIGGSTVGNIQRTDITLSNIQVVNHTEGGINLNWVRGARIINCSVLKSFGTPTEGHAEGEGLDIADSYDITVIGGKYAHNDGAGITFWNVKNAKVIGAQIYNNGSNHGLLDRDSGVRIDAYDVTDENDSISISDCLIYDNQATETDALTAQANSGQNTIAVTDGTKFFSGQVVQVSDSTPQSEYAVVDYMNVNTVYVKSNLTNTYTLAESPTLQGIATQKYGVGEVVTSGINTNTYVVGNQFDGNASAPINVSGSGNKIRGNQGCIASGDTVTITKTIDHAALTDNEDATAYMDFDDAIPAGSIIKAVKCDFTEAFNSDDTSTLTMMIGYVGDLDAFNLNADPGENAFNHTTDVYWGESSCQAPIVSTEKTPRVTFTEDDDGTDIISSANAQGAVTITITYIKA